MHLKNKSNDYVDCLGDIFEDTPKTVFAAIALSLANITSASPDMEDFKAAKERLIEEWAALYNSGIVPQRPPKGGL